RGRPGAVRLGSAWRGSAWRGSARPGVARRGSARRGSARPGAAWLGSARPGAAWLGSAWPGGPGPGQRGAAARLLGFVRGLLRAYPGLVKPEELKHLRRARDLIDREYARPLDVPALAQAAYMSPAHF